jgi:uncharacterized lipoprotein NlpE involved in copper resistance
MKKVLSAAFIVLVFTGICACDRKADAAHNSRNSLNWDGLYTGLIPAAAGPGINVRIQLNKDGSYEMSYQYIDRGSERFEAAGTFVWNEAGSVITLDTEEFPPHYKVAENRLIQLDMEGNIITGPLAEDYVLTKVLP